MNNTTIPPLNQRSCLLKAFQNTRIEEIRMRRTFGRKYEIGNELEY